MPDSAASTQDDPLRERIVAELPGLRAFLRKLAAGRGNLDLDDLVQDVVARALRYQLAFDRERALGPWLRGMAWRVLVDHRAAQRRDPEPLVDAPTPAEEAPVERQEDVARALARLSAVEREVVVRFHVQGASIREIARALRMPEGTVKSHLHRGRRRLAEDTR